MSRGGYLPSAQVRNRRSRTLDPLRTNLPSVRGPLFGRDQELEELVGRLVGESRLVTLTGAGGNGKTRLALAVAENPSTAWSTACSWWSSSRSSEPTTSRRRLRKR